MPCMPRFLKHISSRVPKGPWSKFETRIGNPRLFLKERREGTSKILVMLLDVSRACSARKLGVVMSDIKCDDLKPGPIESQLAS